MHNRNGIGEIILKINSARKVRQTILRAHRTIICKPLYGARNVAVRRVLRQQVQREGQMLVSVIASASFPIVQGRGFSSTVRLASSDHLHPHLYPDTYRGLPGGIRDGDIRQIR
jgi:hypothetical protein